MTVHPEPSRRAEPNTNLSSAQLAEQSILRNEGHFASNGAIVVETGARTGRSPKDRFIVDEPSTSESIDWGEVNQPIDAAVFDRASLSAGAQVAGPALIIEPQTTTYVSADFSAALDDLGNLILTRKGDAS